MKPILGIFLATLLVGCGSGDEDDDSTVDLSAIEGSPNCSSIQGLRTTEYGEATLDVTRRGAAAAANFDTTYSYECFLGVYKYTVTADQEIIGTVSVPEDKDYDFYFYNAAGERVASSTNEGKDVNESISYTVTASDSTPLYVVVYDQLASSETEFELLLRGSTIVAEQEENDCSTEMSNEQALTGTYVTVSGSVADVLDLDCYTIPVTAGKTMEVSLTSEVPDGESVGANLYLGDRSGDVGQSINLADDLTAGTQTLTDSTTFTIDTGVTDVDIEVSAVNDAAKPYTLTIDIRDTEATSTN